MNYFHVHPDDARRLRRWLYSNLLCFLAIVCFLTVIRSETSVPLAAMNSQEQDEQAVLATVLAPQATKATVPFRGPTAVAPQGWRRTDQGWEHVRSWPAPPRPLGEIIEHQQDQEPAWLQFILGTLRQVPPLAFALLQISAIAAIVVLAKPRRLA